MSFDSAEILALWNATLPKKFQIEHDVLRSNLFDNPYYEPDLSAIERSGDEAQAFVGIKSPAISNTRSLGQEFHINACVFADLESGRRCLQQVVRKCRDRGAKSLVFGRDTGHFWPGAPEDWPDLQALLDEFQFDAEDRYFDLERDLTNYEFEDSRSVALEGSYCVLPANREEMSKIDSFMIRNFPGRWQADVLRKCASEMSLDFLKLLWHGEEVVGFAMTQKEGCLLPIGGAVWHKSLGPNWGALGPIGVDAKLRGHGLGHALLGKSLELLRDDGARQTIIDWTTLGSYYGGHGFVPTRYYVARRLLLS